MLIRIILLLHFGSFCSFCIFDFQRHGNSNYGSPYNALRSERSSQGKMEKSFLRYDCTSIVSAFFLPFLRTKPWSFPVPRIWRNRELAPSAIPKTLDCIVHHNWPWSPIMDQNLPVGLYQSHLLRWLPFVGWVETDLLGPYLVLLFIFSLHSLYLLQFDGCQDLPLACFVYFIVLVNNCMLRKKKLFRSVSQILIFIFLLQLSK